MSKIDNQHQLHEDECDATEQTNPHPKRAKRSGRNEEGANAQTSDDHVLDAPEAILNGCPWIAGRFRANRYHRHQGEEANQCKAYAIDGQIANGHRAIGHVFGGYDVCTGRRRILAKRNIFQPFLESGSECDASTNRTKQQHNRVHQSGRC